MPLPWKKKSSTARISRLVADLQSPPKRGGSLVVETGFPTSLIDLFVKNRDRLKKPSSKRTKPQQPHVAGNSRTTGSDPSADDPCFRPAVADDRLNPPAFSAPRPPVPESAVPAAAAAVIPEPPRRNDQSRGEESQAEDAHVESIFGENPNREGFDKVYSNRLFLAVLKVFIVVLFAMCTKGLVMGITISALVLLLLEHLGMVIPSSLKDRWIVKTRNHRDKRRRFIFEGTEKAHFEEEEVGGDGGGLDDDSDGEIKALEPAAIDSIQGGRQEEEEEEEDSVEVELVTRDRRCQEEEGSKDGNLNQGTNKKKSKIVKRIMVPIKMRNQKKKKKESETGIS